MTDAPIFNQADEALEFAGLAALPATHYDRQRLHVAERLGLRVSTLDAQVAAIRPKPEGASGRCMSLRNVVIWDDPVTGAELLAALSETMRRHLILLPNAADALALWVLHTWVFERFPHTPRLTIRSPAKRCGKSTLLEVLHVVSRRPLKADNISAAGVFRTVEAMSPCTLLIDEADAFLRDNEELRGIMNSGFARDGNAIRVVEIDGEQTPVAFRTFAPLAVAAIGKLPDTVEDRAIPVLLKRKTKAETITKLRTPGARARLSELERMAARWAQDEGPHLSLDPAVPDQMGDREGDVSVPLLAIADNAGGEWPKRARVALLDLFGTRAGDESAAEVGAQLLADIKLIFGKQKTALSGERLFSSSLCQSLSAMEERPWPEWRKGKPMTPPQLAHALRPFGVRPQTIRQGKFTAKGYYSADFADAWDRYLLSSPTIPPVSHRHTVTMQAGSAKLPQMAAVTADRCDGSQNGELT